MNRGLMKLRSAGSEMVHKVPNPFTLEDRQLFSFSNLPHLMKTARNGLTFSKKSLLVCMWTVVNSLTPQCGWGNMLHSA